MATSLRHFDPRFLFLRGAPGLGTRDNLPGHGLLYPWLAPFIILGMASLIMRRRREDMIVLALVLIYPLVNAVTDNSPSSYRPIHAAIVFVLLSAAGLAFVLRWDGRLSAPWNKIIVWSFIGLLSVVGALSLLNYLDRYHSEYPIVAADFFGWQYGPRSIVTRFKEEEAHYDAFILDGRGLDGPHIFFRFYAPGDCSRCRVSYSDSLDLDLNRRQLAALWAERELPFSYRTVDTITYPNGKDAFYLIEVGPGTATDSP